MDVDNSNIGDVYQQITKYARNSMVPHHLDWRRKPKIYKHYKDTPMVRLPAPNVDGGLPLWKVISQRRSRRNFSEKILTLEELSQLLWATQGITSIINGYELRASPSAGALYPLETLSLIHI